jgi:hypothetical protein
MVVTRMAERLLEPRASLSEIDFPRDAGANHPLQRPIDSRAPDARRFAVHGVHEIVSAEVPALTQKDLQDAVAL